MTTFVVGASLPGRFPVWRDDYRLCLDERLKAAYQENTGRPPRDPYTLPDALVEQFTYTPRSKYGRALWGRMNAEALQRWEDDGGAT